jgi:Arc/MetJ-type ribon-helix-helix transcriptional regulator
MSITITLSDTLAAALEARRKQSGFATLDDAAEVFLADAIATDGDDLSALGVSTETLRALIEEGEASGPAVEWDADAVRAHVRRRFAGAPR